jgi:hypothetical protein
MMTPAPCAINELSGIRSAFVRAVGVDFPNAFYHRIANLA